MNEQPDEWRAWLKEAMERRATMSEVQLQILDWAEHFEKLESDSARLDKLERAMRAGHSFDAYGWDDEKDEWGRAGIGVLFKDSDTDRWSGADLLADTLGEVIDKLKE